MHVFCMYQLLGEESLERAAEAADNYVLYNKVRLKSGRWGRLGFYLKWPLTCHVADLPHCTVI
jgi:hypothetical protein